MEEDGEHKHPAVGGLCRSLNMVGMFDGGFLCC